MELKPSEWPFKYWLLIGAFLGGPNAANFALNITQNKPVSQSELRKVANDLGKLAYSSRNIVKHIEAIDDDVSLISDQMIRHEERLKAMAEIKARLRTLEDRYLAP